jgi:hypothetical protein
MIKHTVLIIGLCSLMSMVSLGSASAGVASSLITLSDPERAGNAPSCAKALEDKAANPVANAELTQAEKNKKAAYLKALQFLSLPQDLYPIVVAYRMMHVIQSKEEFYERLSLYNDNCDDGNELESIKEYIDEDPLRRIRERHKVRAYEYMQNPDFTLPWQSSIREQTPLMVALFSNPYYYNPGRPNLVRLILSYPQDLDAREDKWDKRTALYIAANHTIPLEHLFLLIEYGINLSTKITWREDTENTDKAVHVSGSVEECVGKNGDHSTRSKFYIYLKCAREFAQCLAPTIPDLRARRK